MNKSYGKSPENPIQLNSIPASRFYLNHLITPEGYHLVYHRPGSVPSKKYEHPIDHYEIMTADNQYHDLYINIYNKTNTWIPPEGFLFDEEILLYPKGLNDYEIEEINEAEIPIVADYIYTEKLTDEMIDEIENTPVLDMFLCANYGVNSRASDFPNSIIIQAIDPEGNPEDGLFHLILPKIKPRGNTPNNLLSNT